MERIVFAESWVHLESEEQKAIIGWLIPRAAGKRLLAVGVGNCALFERLPETSVFGITVSKEECALAREKRFACDLVDKYTSGIMRLPPGFDYIVDSEPFSYAETLGEINNLLFDYQRLLAPAGSLISHIGGMRYRWSRLGSLYPQAPPVTPLEKCKQWVEPYFLWQESGGGIIELRPRRHFEKVGEVHRGEHS